MAKFRFDDLSVDIKALIIDQIKRPTDLVKLCLVNKQLHELTVKCLYRNVSLDIGSSTDNRLSSFLSPKNIGLKHIRQLRLYLAEVRDQCNQDKQAEVVTKMILEFLPEDILEEFSWCPWKPFSADNLLLLYKKQRNMKWLEVMDLDREIIPALRKHEIAHPQAFSSARKLALYPENRETLRLSHYFVQKTTEVLEELIIHANFRELPNTRDIARNDFIEARELNDSATAPGLVSSTIFGHMRPFDQCTPFQNLKSLRLHRVSLRWCADTWCKIVDFTRIENLRIFACAGADTFFGQLCKASHLPKKLKVLEFQHKDNAENEALLALDGFLCLVSGIRDLVIDLENVKALPASAGITRHSKTLATLNIHCSRDDIVTSPGENEELVYDGEEFEKICKACTTLEQLSCAWPATSLIRHPTDEWQAFERAASLLKRLVTLHISTWPTNKPSTQSLPRNIYEYLLQGLARQLFEIVTLQPIIEMIQAELSPSMNNGSGPVDANDLPIPLPTEDETQQISSIDQFSHLRNTRLRIIAFGISDKIFEREDSKNQCIFLRSTSRNAERKRNVYATPIGWCLRQFVEPRSDVLDFVLHQESRPPCRELGSAGLRWDADDDD